jgi:hypothetical protein
VLKTPLEPQITKIRNSLPQHQYLVKRVKELIVDSEELIVNDE